MMPAIKQRVVGKVVAKEERQKRSYASGDMKIPRAPTPKTLHKWYHAHERHGFIGLIDKRHRSGNRTPRMTLEETALLNETVRGYLNCQRPTREEIIRRVGRAFAKENAERRTDSGRRPARPSGALYDAFLPSFAIFIATVSTMQFASGSR